MHALALAAALWAMPAFGECTLGTESCCLGEGGAGDTAATKRTWVPNGASSNWNTTNNWSGTNVPNANNEMAYIQADWYDPAWPANSYDLACLQIVSGNFTATPTASTVTVSIPTATVTASIRSSTVTMAASSNTVTFTVPTATVTMTLRDPVGVSVTTAGGADRVNWTSHGLVSNDPFILTTNGGSMPNPMTSGTVYYVEDVQTTGRFQVRTTPGGGQLNITSNGSNLSGSVPGIITWNSHGRSAGDPVVFTTTGGLPTGLTAGTTYYVAAAPAATTNTFAVAASAGGNAIVNSGSQSGTHSGFGTTLVNWTSHGKSAGDSVTFSSSGSLPTGIDPGTTYYVAASPAPTANAFAITTTPGGTALIATSTGSGTHTAVASTPITWNSHGLAADTPVTLTTTGSLLTGFSNGTTYYVAGTPAPTANTFRLSATVGGAAITASGSDSGTHTGTAAGLINWTAHGLSAGAGVRFSTTGALPTGITAGTTYAVASSPAPTANTFAIASTIGGSAIAFSGGQSGTHTANASGLVTLTGHGLSAGDPVNFTTTGALPTGLSTNTTYFVTSAPSANTLYVGSKPDSIPVITSGGQSGTHSMGYRNLAIKGEYFYNTLLSSMTTNSNFFIEMSGAAAQTFDNVDAVYHLIINNPTTVTIPSGFTIYNGFKLLTGTGTVKIGGTVRVENTTEPIHVPSSATLEVLSGAVLVAEGGITVDGILKVNAGGRIQLGDGTTLQVNAGGLLTLSGTSGNVAVLDASQGGYTYSLNIAGSVNANYFKISRTTAAGMNITSSGTDSVQALSNGDFHYIASGGYGITLNTSTNLPSPDPSDLGFFDEFGYGNIHNINATAYTGSAVTIDDWAGFGGAGYETDPGSKIAWSGQADLALQVTNRTPSGFPGTPIAKGSGATLFGTFGFALNAAGTSTDITAVTFTVTGNNTSSDVAYIRVYSDDNDCVYDGGDTQIGSDLYPTGSPPTATVSIPAATVTVSDTTQKCLHVVMATNSNAKTNATLQIAITGTDDVTNSQGYSFSTASGPPVYGAVTTISGSAVKKWGGGNGPNGGAQNWNANTGDWTPSGFPISTDDCQIGRAYSYPQMNASYTCTNMTLPSAGRMSWNSTTNTLNVLGALTIGSSYTFTNATTGNISMSSTAATQSMTASTAFTGNLVINNTYGGDGLVSVNTDVTVNGTLTLTRGILNIASGTTLTVLGNITVNGGTLRLEPGATLNMGDGRTLSVGASGTLSLVGSAAQTANLTCNGTTTGCAITVDGTIAARYYSLSRLATTGLTINSGASIDGTNYLQDGTYTYPIGSNGYLLRLNRQIPGNALANMTFDTDGSAASNPSSVFTNAAAGVLTISAYSGDLTNCCTTAPTYTITWQAPTTTLKLTLEGSAPASIDQGDTAEVVARYGFQQTQAGPYNDTNLTSVKLTLQGSQNPSDISAVRLYYDSGCTGSGGAQLGNAQTFSGSPPTTTFSGISAAVQADVSSPPKRCIYVEFDIASQATVANTVGVSIQANTDVVNSEGFAFNGSFAPPLAAGTSIINGNTITWTGSSSTAWATAGNWNLNRLPTSSDNCIINSASNNPVISAAGAVCKSLTIGNGTLTINDTYTLSLYGSLTNTGTLTLNGTASLTIRDDGATTTNQTLQSSTALSNLVFNKTAGGYVYIGNSNLTINGLSIPASQNFTFNVRDGDTLVLPTGATLTSGTFQVDGGGTVKVTSGQTITVNGATLTVAGTNDAYPQSTSNKGKFTNNGSGTWSLVASSGTLNLTGFIFDYLDTNGLQVNGTTNLTNLNGGQFTNLSETYASVKAIQFNTSGSIPATATNVGWNWGANNIVPANTEAYLLAYSPGCGGNTITFNGWFGDWYLEPMDPQDKVSGTNCTITIGTAASPVSITSLTATGYDSAISLDWETQWESQHQGFHVYRSLNPLFGYVRVNDELVRNDLTSTSFKGKYRFLDRTVENGKVYYYMVEDVALNGSTSRHGPVSAMPGWQYGDPPAAESDVNEAITENDGSPPGDQGEVANAGAEDLGHGVRVVAKTANTFRIEIIPPAEEITVSTWNALYRQLRLPGYTATLETGYPELVDRIVLVEVSGSYSAVSVAASQVDEAGTSTQRLQPVPSWTANGEGLLEPTYTPNGTAYGSDTITPSTYFTVAPETLSLAGKHYVSIHVKPYRYQALSQTLHRADRILLDVLLSGTAWQPSAPAAEYNASPSAVAGALRVRYTKAGMFEVAYDDLVGAGVDGPFSGVSVDSFRAYYLGSQIPLDVVGPSNFGPGSGLRFYGPHTRKVEDLHSEVVITTFALGDGAPLRMGELPADPTGYPAGAMTATLAVVEREQDMTAILDLPFADLVDRFFWRRIYAPAGSSGTPDSRFNLSPVLPNLVSGVDYPVRLELHGRGRNTRSQGNQHRIGVFLNGSGTPSAEATFSGDGPQTFEWDLPSASFVNGTNSVIVEVFSDFVVNPDNAIFDIDRLKVEYYRSLDALSGRATLLDPPVGGSLSVDGFGAGATVEVYDVSNATQPLRLSEVLHEDDGQTKVTFGLSRDYYDAPPSTLEAVEDGAYLKPAQFALVEGYGDSLRHAGRGADWIVIGPDNLIDEAQSLISYRQSQGLRVARVTPRQIYAEFSHGAVSSQAIRDFIRYAHAHWQSPAPRYVLFLGDGTYDPRDRLAYGLGYDLAPMPLVKGTYVDYASDHWFVADDQGSPLVAVGRLPARDPALIRQFADKIIAYEGGSRAPAGLGARRVVYLSDEDFVNEGFSLKTRALGQAFSGEYDALTPVYVDRADAADDAAMKNEIISQFNSAPAMITYVGHGAEYLWGTGDAFTSEYASQLTNTRLPVVVGLNCQNALFYDADPETISMAESLVLNPKGGAAAFLGFTTMTVPTAQLNIQTVLQNQLAGEFSIPHHELRLGDVLLQTKTVLVANPHLKDALHSLSLIGDPATRVPSSLFAPTPASDPDPTPPSDDEPASEEPAPGGSEALSPPQASSSGKGGGCGRVVGEQSSNGPVQGAILFLWLILLSALARRAALSHASRRGPHLRS